MEIRSARDNDAAEIASIFDYEVERSPQIWVETFVTVEDRREWIAARQTAGFPVLIAEDDGQVLGFGSFGPFRPYEGFRQTVASRTARRALPSSGSVAGCRAKSMCRR